jgi:hypothetical protein
VFSDEKLWLKLKKWTFEKSEKFDDEFEFESFSIDILGL